MRCVLAVRCEYANPCHKSECLNIFYAKIAKTQSRKEQHFSCVFTLHAAGTRVIRGRQVAYCSMWNCVANEMRIDSS